MKDIAAALLAAQRDMPELQKNAINPHFRSKYISLDSLMEQVLPVLNRHGLVLLQWPTALDRRTTKDGEIQLGTEPALRTKLLHAESGEAFEDVMPLILGKNDPQGQGSAITYARRYALMSILGLVADQDDDANAVAPKQSSGGRRKPGATQSAPSGADEPAPF